MQSVPGINVDVIEVGHQPDLSSNLEKFLVDEEELGGRASGRGFLEHLGCVHNVGREVIAAFWQGVAEDGSQKGFGEVVEGRRKRRTRVSKIVVAQVILLPLEIAVGGHFGDDEGCVFLRETV